jgi:hypothetical protein
MICGPGGDRTLASCLPRTSAGTIHQAHKWRGQRICDLLMIRWPFTSHSSALSILSPLSTIAPSSTAMTRAWTYSRSRVHLSSIHSQRAWFVEALNANFDHGYDGRRQKRLPRRICRDIARSNAKFHINVHSPSWMPCFLIKASATSL